MNTVMKSGLRLTRKYGQDYFLVPDTGDLAGDLRSWIHTMVAVSTMTMCASNQ
ncbi:hypothetical protein [Catelliglobosispora koreensis]|uniref:hypothetical protein n=1 Tax=Catelliglobosispora koreensis TaxID=129052 RepID=UPI0012FC4A38|nr:hypothetical protein [Catelliglobosispora koreensis]